MRSSPSFVAFLLIAVPVSVAYAPVIWPPAAPGAYEYRRDGVVTETLDLCYGLPALASLYGPPTCVLQTDIYCDNYVKCPGDEEDEYECPSGASWYDVCVGHRCTRWYDLYSDDAGTFGYCITGVAGEPAWPETVSLCPDCVIGFDDPCALDTNICFENRMVCARNTLPCPAGQHCDPTMVQCTPDATPCRIPTVTNGTEVTYTDLCDVDNGFECVAGAGNVTCVRRTAINCTHCAVSVPVCYGTPSPSYVCNATRGQCDEIYSPQRSYYLDFIAYRFCDTATAPYGEEIDICHCSGDVCSLDVEIWDAAAMTCRVNGLPCDDGDESTRDACSPIGSAGPRECYHCPESRMGAGGGRCDTKVCGPGGVVSTHFTCGLALGLAIGVPCGVVAIVVAAALAAFAYNQRTHKKWP